MADYEHVVKIRNMYGSLFLDYRKNPEKIYGSSATCLLV